MISRLLRWLLRKWSFVKTLNLYFVSGEVYFAFCVLYVWYSCELFFHAISWALSRKFISYRAFLIKSCFLCNSSKKNVGYQLNFSLSTLVLCLQACAIYVGMDEKKGKRRPNVASPVNRWSHDILFYLFFIPVVWSAYGCTQRTRADRGALHW